MSEEAENKFAFSGSYSGFATVKVPINTRYEPLPDITAWELAQILPYMLGKPLYKEDWEALGPAQRHCPPLEGTQIPK